VTGGAGFIGAHLASALLSRGHRVRVLDSLDPQVHGACPAPGVPDGVEMVRGDLLDGDLLDRALEGIDVVFHQAAREGVAQSMYLAASYTRVNCVGTALLMEKIPFDLLYARLDFVRAGGRLSIMEVELIEPIFSFNLVPASISRLVQAALSKLESQR
jgi:GDP-D-mannose dehydratase